MSIESLSTQADRSDALKGFDGLDDCHRQTQVALAHLASMIARLSNREVDSGARDLAREVVQHFSTVSRQHHLDEEQHIFPTLLATGDAETVQAIQRLQQDHAWLEVDWTALSPMVDAIACGQSCYDLDTLREGAEIFMALSHEHIALEESLIYPMARARLGPSTGDAMTRDMLGRRRTSDKQKQTPNDSLATQEGQHP